LEVDLAPGRARPPVADTLIHTPPQVQAPEPACTRAGMLHECTRRRGEKGGALHSKGDRLGQDSDGSWTGRVRRGTSLAPRPDPLIKGTARASPSRATPDSRGTASWAGP
jgi:hypothetical protein